MELPLLSKSARSCGNFDGSHLQTTKSTEGYTAVLEYHTKDGIFTEGLEPGVISLLKDTAENYRLDPGHKRYMCVHFKTRADTPNEVGVYVHGFISQLLDSSLRENLKLRIHFSMTVLRKIGGQLIQSAMINSEIDLGTPRGIVQDLLEVQPSGTEDGRCGGSEVYFGGLCNCYQDDARIVLSAYELKRLTRFVKGTIKVVFFSGKCPQRICYIFKDRTFCSDFTIVASNGAEFPCHKVILAAETPVFARMLGIDMKESRSSRVEMKDKSEESVKGFLGFLYENNIKIAAGGCQTALELLQIGHQYAVKGLETAVQTMILAKSDDWFEDEDAFELFLFTRNVEAFKDLKMKAVNVIKAKSKDMTGIQFEQFMVFCKKDADAALDLVRNVAAS